MNSKNTKLQEKEMQNLEIKPIAHIESQFHDKFGIPRQANLAPSLMADIIFEPEFRNPDCIRGLECVSHIWILWEFSEFRNKEWSPLVRPPRLGGNKKMGVFATRSPLRPNPLALSAVKIENINLNTSNGPIITISGADIMNGTPIYDIKPYVPYADSISEATSTLFTKPLQLEKVNFGKISTKKINPKTLKALEEILLQDPRPAYKKLGTDNYSFEFAEYHIEFYVENNIVNITKLIKI
ncbi:MAG: tRNA (N6-threonylcarbamoyladenosine(37)-N6)-methyltransferase TrmO [Bacteroidales bacterium]|nr:tRNA (N6-threonylcarbamoyladenosine(37)-N6)-methyltransferase TrmO [Bacteroidales bacterium]